MSETLLHQVSFKVINLKSVFLSVFLFFVYFFLERFYKISFKIIFSKKNRISACLELLCRDNVMEHPISTAMRVKGGRLMGYYPYLGRGVIPFQYSTAKAMSAYHLG